jgi:hypothetical protein
MNKVYCYKQPDSNLTVSNKSDHIIVGEYYDYIEYIFGNHFYIDLIDTNDPNHRILCIRQEDFHKWFLTQAEWREKQIDNILND